LKKNIGITLLGSLSLMLILSGCGSKFNGNNIRSSQTSNTVTSIDESYEIGKANSIKISTELSNSSVKTYEGEKIKIVGVIGTESEGVKFNLVGDQVKIEEEYSSINIGVNNDEKISKYEILIPEKYNGDLSIEYGAGSIDIQDIKVDKFKIEGGAGELNVKNVVFNDLNLSSGVGSVKISLGEKCGNIKIEGGIGETRLKMKEVGGSLKVDSGIGSVDIQVPENAPIYFKTSTGVGSKDVDSVKTSGEKTYLFELNVGLGKVKVHN